MSDKGIIFSAPMVRALLDGRKTQTRRLLTNARVFATPESRAFSLKKAELTRALQGADRWRHLGGTGWFWESDAFDYQAPATRTGWMAHLPYAPVDRLYVREAHYFNHYEYADRRAPKERPADLTDEYICYRATEDDCEIQNEARWRPSIHMPRWASRMFLAVTDVRVQRLQEISDEDAISEGIEARGAGSLWGWCDYEEKNPNVYRQFADPRRSFQSLWNSLHTDEGERWQDNPWIVAVSFDVHHGNIDAPK